MKEKIDKLIEGSVTEMAEMAYKIRDDIDPEKVFLRGDVVKVTLESPADREIFKRFFKPLKSEESDYYQRSNTGSEMMIIKKADQNGILLIPAKL